MVAKYILFALVLQGVASVDPCQTPSHKDGDCIPITDCPPLISILQRRPVSNSNLALLRKSHCGFSGRLSKVCCPIEFSTPPTTEPEDLEEPEERGLLLPISSRLLPDLNTCGLTTQSRIYGGEQTELDEFPWMALLQYQRASGSKGFFCGGALISNRYVLTAAHCVHPKRLSGLRLVGVRLGEHNTETNPDCFESKFGGDDCAPEPIDVGLEQVIMHKDYTTDINNRNDIALLRLKKNITFTDFVKPICLPLQPDERKKTYVNMKLHVAGWGDTEDRTTTASPVKLKVQVPVKQLTSCNQTYVNLTKGSVSLTINQICAGGEMGKDSCKGDSGGPLMTLSLDKNKDPRWFVAGIVSFGPTACGTGSIPGIYTRVANYMTWIVNKLRP